MIQTAGRMREAMHKAAGLCNIRLANADMGMGKRRQQRTQHNKYRPQQN